MSSEFFQTALKKEWQEGPKLQIDLPDVDRDTFTIYVKWLYTSSITAVTKDYMALAKCYCLGERLLDRKFQNRVITAIVMRSRESNGKSKTYPDEPVAVIYQSTPKDSPARRLMVDFFVRYGRRAWVENILRWDSSTEPAQLEFLRDLSMSLMEIRTVPFGTQDKFKALDSGEPTPYFLEVPDSTET